MDLIIYAVIAVFVVLIYIIIVYNKVVSYSNKVDQAFSGIDIALKRRFDLIPNLVNTVKGYAKHESETIEKIIRARSESLKELASKDGSSEAYTKNLMAIAESYPQIKASENFLNLQKELADAEDYIQAARRLYNSNVASYNDLIQSFPSNMIASSCNFSARSFYEAKEQERENIQVDFNN